MDANIQKYLALVKTVEYGSFTKAAEMLNYSQSGISRMIRDLENDWNIILLERGKAGVKLTSDGLELLPYARTLIESYQKLLGEIDELNGLRAGLIRIGSLESAAVSVLPDVISEYSKDYPGMEFEIMTGSYEEVESWLDKGRIDLAVSKLPASGDFETEFIVQDRLTAIFPASKAPDIKKAIPLAAVCDEFFIMPEYGAKEEISSLFERCGLSPRTRITVKNEAAALAMVGKGLGITILPRMSIGHSENIEARELEIPAYIDIGLLVKNKRSASLAVRRMMDYFL